ncbi:hypothetical protein GIB67_008580, partial [Kingdonia uniflora]
FLLLELVTLHRPKQESPQQSKILYLNLNKSLKYRSKTRKFFNLPFLRWEREEEIPQATNMICDLIQFESLKS